MGSKLVSVGEREQARAKATRIIYRRPRPFWRSLARSEENQFPADPKVWEEKTMGNLEIKSILTSKQKVHPSQKRKLEAESTRVTDSTSYRLHRHLDPLNSDRHSW